MAATPKAVVQTPAMRRLLDEIRDLEAERAALKAEKAELPPGAYGRGQAALLDDRLRGLGQRIQDHCQALAALKRGEQAQAPPSPFDAVEPLESFIARQARQQVDPPTWARIVALATRQREAALERVARKARA
ncbi:hypothetical protein EVJ50_06765 [Synechococcus sp. RSCCF101]|uniref:hypothetical protein n=1 Tax=Synechococcus sp. RSCCF101 TaxID=2511069 RepID=UPI0012458A0A|nr:hypothetical protein [Synechococcus sp. RSCCF101]QEY31982.1 hypothetical protein EVJ50_06765 [Synechococcus sp. RSCCF101]